MMRDILEKMVSEDIGDDVYSYTVDVDLDVLGLDDGERALGPQDALVHYRMELDFRSWGLKDIEVTPVGEVEFEVEVVDDDENVQFTIPVSLEFEVKDVNIEWVGGHSYVPEMLHIAVNAKGEITEATLGFYYISK